MLANLAGTKWGTWALFICAFADASFLPMPVTTFFLILLVLNTRMTFKYVGLAVAGTLAGAMTGYSIGHFLWLKPDGEFTAAVQFIFNHIPGFSQDVYERVHVLYTRWNFWILCAATATPLPYGMFSVTSGVFDINIFIFSLATLFCQGIKYLFLTFITLKLGSLTRRFKDLNWKPVAIITTATILAAIALRVGI
jgi:membrane protein YqaA with SNARE-associated domain